MRTNLLRVMTQQRMKRSENENVSENKGRSSQSEDMTHQRMRMYKE